MIRTIVSIRWRHLHNTTVVSEINNVFPSPAFNLGFMSLIFIPLTYSPLHSYLPAHYPLLPSPRWILKQLPKMKISLPALLLSTAAISNAQVVLWVGVRWLSLPYLRVTNYLDSDPDTNTIVCPAPVGSFPLSYCAGDSLKTNIIIRCNGLRGQPGNCNDK